MVNVQAVGVMADWVPGSDPVGAIFESTIGNLGPLERQLLHFCATSNVLAVRWLLCLGAQRDARDANGTTCLHIACRAGSLQVVWELLDGHGLESADCAGWTPLHIAAHMGRREVVIRLLQLQADPLARNLGRQTPAELCTDMATLEALRACHLYFEDTGGQAQDLYDYHTDWDLGGEEERDSLGALDECEHIPYFMPPVPALPMLRFAQSRETLWRLGVLIFNVMPSFGLAFIVATGNAENYADALQTVLQRSDVKRAEVGAFLGEALSLSTLTCLSLLDSIPIFNTGVVSSLKCVFQLFQLPGDLRKINRLLKILAQVWWRRQKIALAVKEARVAALAELESTREGSSTQPSTPQADDNAGIGCNSSHDVCAGPDISASAQEQEKHDVAVECIGSDLPSVAQEEVCGPDLKDCLASKDAMCQLLFSTVLLHWHVHGNGRVQKKEMDLYEWMRLNRGLGTAGGDIPEHVQQRIHEAISKDFMPELALFAPGHGPVILPGCVTESFAGGPDEGAGTPRDALPGTWSSAVASCAAVEGWVHPLPHGMQIFKSQLPVTGGEVPSSVAGIAHLEGFRAAVDEPTMISDRYEDDGLDPEDTWYEALFPKRRKDYGRWLSLCGPFLFFAFGQQRAEESEAGATIAAESSSSAFGGTYAPAQDAPRRSDVIPDNVPHMFLDASSTCIAGVDATLCAITLMGAAQPTQAVVQLGASDSVTTHITVVSFLTDGCWEELRLSRLELRFPNSVELELWLAYLVKVVNPLDPSGANLFPSEGWSWNEARVAELESMVRKQRESEQQATPREIRRRHMSM